MISSRPFENFFVTSHLFGNPRTKEKWISTREHERREWPGVGRNPRWKCYFHGLSVTSNFQKQVSFIEHSSELPPLTENRYPIGNIPFLIGRISMITDTYCLRMTAIGRRVRCSWEARTPIEILDDNIHYHHQNIRKELEIDVEKKRIKF